MGGKAYADIYGPAERPLRAVILAAAQGADPGVAYPRALQRLGDRAILDLRSRMGRPFRAAGGGR